MNRRIFFKRAAIAAGAVVAAPLLKLLPEKKIYKLKSAINYAVNGHTYEASQNGSCVTISNLEKLVADFNKANLHPSQISFYLHPSQEEALKESYKELSKHYPNFEIEKDRMYGNMQLRQYNLYPKVYL